MASGQERYLVFLAYLREIQWIFKHYDVKITWKTGGERIMLTQSQGSRCVETELAQTHIWQWTCKFVQLNCCHIVPAGDVTHTAFILFITNLHRMPEHTQNSRRSSIMTSFLTRTTFILLHLLLFLLPPVCLLTSLLYCHSSPPFHLVLECVTLKH